MTSVIEHAIRFRAEETHARTRLAVMPTLKHGAHGLESAVEIFEREVVAALRTQQGEDEDAIEIELQHIRFTIVLRVQ